LQSPVRDQLQLNQANQTERAALGPAQILPLQPQRSSREAALAVRAPVALFVYNRPEHTVRAINALAACDGAAQSDLVIFSDAPKSASAAPAVALVRQVIAGVGGFKSVRCIQNEENKGAARSIINGLTMMLREHGRAIVIEDDLICSPHTLTYLNACLERYADCPNVMSACAYNFPRRLMRIPSEYEYDAYFTPRFFPWGWATWERTLGVVDWAVSDFHRFMSTASEVQALRDIGDDLLDLLVRQQAGEFDDWVLPYSFSQFRHHYLSVCPVRSLVDNIGHDGSGLHCHDTRLFQNAVSDVAPVLRLPETIFADQRLLRASQIASSNAIVRRAYRRAMDSALKVRELLAARYPPSRGQ